MRQIGSIAEETEARLLADYLLAKGMPATSEREGHHWAIWVREENHVESAKDILHGFLKSETSDPYERVVAEAKAARARELRERMDEVTGRAEAVPESPAPTSAPLSQRAPLVLLLTVLTLFVGAVTEAGQFRNELFHTLMTADLRLFTESSDGLAQIRQGQLWRLVTPIFLHGSWLHLLFNLSWLYYLGLQVESRRGTVFLGGLVLAFALVSNMAQFFASGPNFLGMSGVVYGLFGYVWMCQLFPTPGSRRYVLSEFSIFVLVFFLVLGFADGLNQMVAEDVAVANGAHVGGLAAGVVIGVLDSLARRSE